MDAISQHWLRQKLRHIANESAELPGLRLLGKPLYRRMFRRPSGGGNAYFGRYASFAEARAAAPATLPHSYAAFPASGMYRREHDRLRVSQYPLLHWVGRLLGEGQRRFFDLGGNDGMTYYAFGRHLDFPDDLRWTVHDVPDVMADGEAWALAHDPARRLAFAASRHGADGQDVLVTSGTLQYLDYTLPQLLGELVQPPAHVLVNLVPMHPTLDFFTLQNLGPAVLPYHVQAIPPFIAAMQALGYEVRDQWRSTERSLRVPFEPACRVDGYEGFSFRRAAAAQAS